MFALGAALATVLIASVADDFAKGLAPGISLTYESDSTAQPPWQVDTVQFGASVGGKSSVTRVVLRIHPGAPPTPRVYHVENDILSVWDAAASVWRVQRPLAPRREVVVRQANGDTTRVTTRDTSSVQVGDRRILVLHTTFLTRSRSGRYARLTEEYAPSLATAVSGAFESADSLAGPWRTTQRFKLVAIK